MAPQHRSLTNFRLLLLVWRISAGLKGVVLSLEFVIAVITWAVCYEFWMKNPWWDQVLSVMPNVLGFTLGGFAIFLGFGDERFKNMLAGDEPGDSGGSPYISVAASFVLFVVFQLASIICAIVAKALHFPTPPSLKEWHRVIAVGELIGSGIGYFLFLLALLLALRATFRIFRLARWYDAFVSSEKARPKNMNKSSWSD